MLIDRSATAAGGAVDAGGEGWIKVETLFGDRLLAHQALSVAAVDDPLKCGLDPHELLFALAFGSKRHLLLLDGIDARNAADARLIQFDRITAASTDRLQRFQLLAACFQALAETCKIQICTHRNSIRRDKAECHVPAVEVGGGFGGVFLTDRQAARVIVN